MTEMPKKTSRKFSEYKLSTFPPSVWLGLSASASHHCLLVSLSLSAHLSLSLSPECYCPPMVWYRVSIYLSVSAFPSPSCFPLATTSPSALISSVPSWPLSDLETPTYPHRVLFCLVWNPAQQRSQGDLWGASGSGDYRYCHMSPPAVRLELLQPGS